MPAHHSKSSNMSPRRRLSSAISRFSLTKTKALVLPSTPPNDPSPIDFPFPALHSDSQTMKNYDYQRSNKIPLRSPAQFPANLNFSQRTIYVFDSGEDEVENKLNPCLDKVISGPNHSTSPENSHNVKKNERSIAHRMLPLPRLQSENTKDKKVNLNRFSVNKNISFQLPSKGSSQKSEQSRSQTATSQPMTPELPPPSSSLFSILYSPRIFEPSQTLNTALCPQIDMSLSSSPFFNENHPTLTWTKTPSTPLIGCLSCEICEKNQKYIYHSSTPQSIPEPETPEMYVNVQSGYNHSTARGKFIGSTQSPGIFNFPTPIKPLKTISRQKVPLLSPHDIPSPLNARGFMLKNSAARGPSADMLATLQFLSDLCKKSSVCTEEEDSILDNTTTGSIIEEAK